MKNKKHKTTTKRKTKHYNKVIKFCNHCGGALRYSQEDVSCLMCGRNAGHFCNNCQNSHNLIKKSA